MGKNGERESKDGQIESGSGRQCPFAVFDRGVLVMAARFYTVESAWDFRLIGSSR